MKRIIATIGLLCVGLSGAGCETNAQVTINIFNLNDVLRAKPIDETRFTVQYQTTSMPDTLQPDKKEEETLMLKVGDKCSVYYSYAKFLTDSVLEADKAAGASQEVINEHLQRFPCLTRADYCRMTGHDKQRAINELNIFIERGLLIRYGAGKLVVYAKKTEE